MTPDEELGLQTYRGGWSGHKLYVWDPLSKSHNGHTIMECRRWTWLWRICHQSLDPKAEWRRGIRHPTLTNQNRMPTPCAMTLESKARRIWRDRYFQAKIPSWIRYKWIEDLGNTCFKQAQNIPFNSSKVVKPWFDHHHPVRWSIILQKCCSFRVALAAGIISEKSPLRSMFPTSSGQKSERSFWRK